MPVFQYKAYNADGKELSGEIEAASIKDAANSLKKNGLYPKEVYLFSKKRKKFRIIYPKISTGELDQATRHLSTLIKSGSPLYDALSVLAGEIKNKELRNRFIHIKEKLSEGFSFAKALEMHGDVFPEIYQRMVEAGEATGSLDRVLDKLADYLENRAMVIEKVRTAAVYPMLMTIVGVIVLSFLFIFVMPKITRIFEDTGRALPFITVILLKTANILKDYGYILLLAAIASGFGMRFLMKKTKAKELKEMVFLRLPLIDKFFLSFHSAAFSRTLGSLLDGGVPMIKALDMTKKVVGSIGFENALTDAIKGVTEGAALSASLKRSNIIPGILVHIIAIGERSGDLSRLLLNIADAYEMEFETSLGRLLSLLEPLLIIVMGFIVGFIVLAILLPIFELNQIAG